MKRIIKNEKGQGIMEYVIISSLVGICCLVAVRQFGDVVQKRIDNMKSQITEEIQLKSYKK
jgi:Flp pilus assembly pilin Flp